VEATIGGGGGHAASLSKTLRHAILRGHRMTAAPRKRPFYLVVALLGAVVFGAYGALQGWSAFLQYRGAIDPALASQEIPNPDDRAAFVARLEACQAALDAVKTWGWPLAVAAIVLGSAMFVFAMRGLAGSSSARAILLQLVVVQAGVNVVEHRLLRGVFEADVNLWETAETTYIRENVPEWTHPEARTHAWGVTARSAYPFSLAAQTFGSALIVVALTRRRTREFFDASGQALGEQ